MREQVATAFLRPLKTAMADLKELLTDAGYTDVRTHLNSGNVILTGPSAPAKGLHLVGVDY